MLKNKLTIFFNFLDNWLNEIETWCPSINYIVYTGSQEERRYLRYDILENKFEKD